ARWPRYLPAEVRVPWFLVTSIACSVPNSHDAPGGGHLGNDSETDADGDGYSAGLDCDDDDASVHPGAVETCGNGIDDNCHDGADGCGWAGEVAIAGLEIGTDLY